MQKKMIALAIAAAFATPVAMAETANVNVYGAIDGGLRSVTSAGNTANNFGSGTYNSNRWGIKGSEDLGDGMKALFGLEGSLNTGSGAGGTNLFDRNATVGLQGGFGKIELGRQYSVAFKTIATYDPMGYKFLGITQQGPTPPAANIWLSNDISYSAKFDDVVVMAEHTIPATGDDSTSLTAIGLGYASGDLNVGGAYTKTKPAVGSIAEVTHYTAGAGYKFGDAKVSLGYARNTTADATKDAVSTFTFLGGSFKATSLVAVTAGYYKNVNNAAGATAETTTVTMIAAATYTLSKRTNLYVEADKKSVDFGGTTIDSNGYSLGLATTF